jgi:pyruvate dehydrogenase E2 component (dihydrolipoamide acetyltransferase)
MKADVLRAAEEAKAIPEREDLFGKVIPMNKMRQVIARRLSESSLTAPHIYLFTDVNMEKVLIGRESILEDFEWQFNVRPSINDFLIKAVALTLREYPLLNATVKGDEIHVHPEINVGLAVALDDGLIVPAIPRADELGLGTIAQMRVDLVDRAKKAKLKIEEVQRGTFTISSLASFDITFFTAILNPPQSGILTVGKTQDQLYLEDSQVKKRKVANCGLSVDHRIVDGAVAAAFLQSLKVKLENPSYAFM